MSVPVGQTVYAIDTLTYLRKTSTGWRSLIASEAEHLAANDPTLFATPQHVDKMIDQRMNTVLSDELHSEMFFMGMM